MTRPNRSATRLQAALLVAAVLSLGVSPAFAVLPPHVYRERIAASKIKAIARVQGIKVLSTSRGVQMKEVTFKLEKAFAEGVPAVFTGTCSSVLPWGRPPVGGTIYMSPAKGERVYVTVSKKGGSITSYTLMTPRLDEALRKDPSRVKPDMASVHVEDGSDKLVDAANKLIDNGQIDAALAELDKALAITSLNPQAHLSRARAHAHAGKLAECLEDCTRAIQVDPNMREAYLHRGQVHQMAGSYARAAMDYKKCIALDAESPRGYNALAWLYATCADASHRDAKEAVSLAKKALAIDSQAHILDTLACAYAAKGDFKRAIKTQKEAISVCLHDRARAEYAKRLKLFEQGKAYVQPAPGK